MHSPSRIMPFFFFFITILVLFNYLKKCEARDTIYVRNPLSDNGSTLVSAGSRFELGFFTPQGSQKSHRYVGVWYYSLTPRTVVWVANRNYPLSDSCGIFGIDAEDGNIKLCCGNEVSFNVTSSENSKSSNRTLQLLDTGNLILSDDQSGRTRRWQSFENPTDTFLPGMKMNDNMVLTSWAAPSDPSNGNYKFQQHQGVYTILNRSTVLWRTGEPGMFRNELPFFVIQILSNTSIPFPNYTRGSTYSNTNTRVLMNSSGEIQYYNLVNGGRWELLSSEPHNPCSVYDACGKFAVCNMKNKQMCQCLPGYKSASLGSWRVGQYSDGCERESKCSQEDGHKDGFKNMSLVRVGGEAIPFDGAQNEDACRDECSNECKCTAYLYATADVRDRGAGNSAVKCRIWTSDLVNLREDSDRGQLLSLRVPFSPRGDILLPSEPTCNLFTDCKDQPNSVCEDKGSGQKRCYCKPGYQWDESNVNCTLGSKGSKNKFPMRYVIALVVLLTGGILAFCTCYILYRKKRMAKQFSKYMRSTHSNIGVVMFSYGSERQINELMLENDKRIEVPFYNLETILSATGHFAGANELGRGGYGPVYKGKFPGGREMAVKRLSSCSSQGIDEFLNEVVLIAKLQHRNLVRLLGYCIKEKEKILLYEFMPNRSLDSFIFDENNCLLLDWKKRFDIVLGIARGLLYLHQDSRLRIVHRDLKTSNILLDEEMNPKISDFGLARIVQGKGTEASTNKVVGTYGYMSPEYALDGKFSIKSDVFSFGVVMLEIISGKRNNGFYNSHEVLNLLGYAWRMWSEDKALDLADPTLIHEPHEKSQVLKCINIGLLCVQEDPNERPSMSNVVIMLGSENSNPLPSPSQPAFVVRRRQSSTSTISFNGLTISMEQGR